MVCMGFALTITLKIILLCEFFFFFLISNKYIDFKFFILIFYFILFLLLFLLGAEHRVGPAHKPCQSSLLSLPPKVFKEAMSLNET